MSSKFILAISTSSGVARVAAVDAGEQVLFQFEITDYKSQSTQLLPKVQAHFQDHGLQADQVAAIAVDVGPGGFTSLRTACGVAQGLALAWKVPTVPMTSFECMSPIAGDSLNHPLNDSAGLTALIDARLNELYFARLFRSEKGTEWLILPSLLPVGELAGLGSQVICDPAALILAEGSGLNAIPGKVCAIRLGSLAWQELRAGRVSQPLDCQPLYVREKVAQTTSERMALKHGSV